MADVRVRRRYSGLWWLWLVLALLALMLLWFLFVGEHAGPDDARSRKIDNPAVAITPRA